jgi:hypothetical protein
VPYPLLAFVSSSRIMTNSWAYSVSVVIVREHTCSLVTGQTGQESTATASHCGRTRIIASRGDPWGPNVFRSLDFSFIV